MHGDLHTGSVMVAALQPDAPTAVIDAAGHLTPPPPSPDAPAVVIDAAPACYSPLRHPLTPTPLHCTPHLLPHTHTPLQVIDAEFAFYGPAAFDLGVLMANLFFAALRHAPRPDDLGAPQVTPPRRTHAAPPPLS